MIHASRRLLLSLCFLAVATTTTRTWVTASSEASSHNDEPLSLNSLVSQQLSESVSSLVTEHLQQQKAPFHELSLRNLQATNNQEDFDEFRELLSHATIRLPDFEARDTLLFFELTVSATNVKCSDIDLGDMQISYALESAQRLTFQVDINDLGIKCTLNYNWAYSFFSGNGAATIVLADNYASTQVGFSSQDFSIAPPTNTTVEACSAEISITDMQFSGSITDQVLNVFESLLRPYVQDAVSGRICDELGSLGTTLVQDMIGRVAEFLDPYLKPLPVEELNPTFAEQNLDVPDGVRLMDFQDEGPNQTWFYDVLQEVDSAFGVWVIDPYSENPRREDGKDLAINVFLRENILENRALSLNISDLPFGLDPVIFQGHDELTETTITVQTVHVYGFDTFNYFAPFINEGKYTLQNELSWDFLSFELDVVLDIKPSTQENSIIEDPNEAMAIQEHVKISFGVDDINATVSLMLAVDQDKFEALKVGPLMYMENMLPCFMSSVFKSELTVFEATVGNIREPTLDGFISEGIDNVVTQSVKAAFLMYESVVIRALPNIFQLTFKRLLNDSFFRSYDEKCPEPTPTTGFIDFRDLLLDAEESPTLGGSGLEPYGSIAADMFYFLKSQLATLEEDGTLSANDMFIRPLTRAQSGIPGTVSMPDELFSLSASAFDLAGFNDILEGFKVALSDIRMQNIDTLVPPFQLLEPTGNPYALDNELHLGPVQDRPLNVTARLLLSFGDNALFAMNNEIELSLTSSAFEILMELLVRVEAMSLMNFPLGSIFELDCWLATVPAPAMNELGLRIDPAEDRGLKMVNFSNKFDDLNVGINCLNCTNAGMALLPPIFEAMRQTGVTAVLATRMKVLVEDAVVSEMFQTVLDRFLLNAPKRCPHRPEYIADGDSIGEDHADLPLPALSATSIDTAQFVIATAFQIGFIMFTQAHMLSEVNPADPLEEQQNFVVPEGSNLVNFTDFEVNLPEWLGAAVDELLDMVRGTRVDPSTGEGHLGVNLFLRDLLGVNGTLSWPFEGLRFGPEELQIELHSIKIEGLDSFTKFDVLVPAADQTILNDVAMEMVSFAVELSLHSAKASQRMSLAFKFDEISMSIPLFAAIDRDLFKSVQLGSLLNIQSIVPCLLSSVYGFKIPNMVVNVGKIHKPTVVGLMPETDTALTTLVDTLFEQYGASMQTAVPSMFDNGIRPLLNSWVNAFITGQAKGCSNPIIDAMASARKLMQSAGPPFLDFRDLLLSGKEAELLGGRGDSRYGDLIRTVWDMIEGRVLEADNATGVIPLNRDVIAPFTESSSGSAGDIFFPGELFGEDINLAVGGLVAGISFKISDIRLENVDTIGAPFSILDPVKDEPSLLDNRATIGTTDPLRLVVRVYLKIDTETETIKNDFDVRADIHTLSMVLTTLLKVSEYRFAAFPIGDVFNLDCWLATIPPPPLDEFGVRPDGTQPTAALEELVVSVRKLNLNITCTECTSPAMRELAALWSTPEASTSVTLAANNLVDYLLEVLGDGMLQTRIDRMLNDAAKLCPHSPEYSEDFTSFKYRPYESDTDVNDMQFVVMLMIVLGCLIGIVTVLVLIIKLFVRRRHRKWLKTLSTAHLLALKRRQEKEQEKEAELNAMTQSMFTSCDVPLLVRWLIPLIILGNIALFLSGHLSLGAEVKIQARIAGQLLEFDKFYQFSMAQSTIQIWQAGGKELASLILVFSGIWPYTKQLITLALWFLPPSLCSISRRGSIFLWLDTLAKWSIIDIFTLVVSVAAFRLSIKSPDVGFLPDNLYQLDLIVVPMWGLYANMLAQLISQVSSHFIIHYHRNIVHRATNYYKQQHHLVSQSVALRQMPSSDDLIEDPYGDRKDYLHNHAYARPHRAESEKLITRSFVNGLVVVGALGLAVLVIVGCSLPSAALEFLGVFGIAVESGQNWEQAVRELSLFGFVRDLMDQARFVGGAKSFVGLGSLSALMVITVLIIPLAQTATLLWHWFVPMAGRRRKRLSVFLEILQAWQYCEVYILSVIVATWQLGPISTFMINYYCTSFQETFDTLAFFGFIEEEDAQCFRVNPSVKGAAYILAAGAVCLALFNSFVMSAVRQYFRDRDEVNSRAEWKAILFENMENARETQRPSPSDNKEQEEKARWSPEVDTTFDASADDESEEQGRQGAEKCINPVPVLFTDKFRWVLRNANSTEALNGRPPPPTLSALNTLSQLAAEESSSTSDEEQPTAFSAAIPNTTSHASPPSPQMLDFEGDSEMKSIESQSMYLEDSSDALPQYSKQTDSTQESLEHDNNARSVQTANTFPETVEPSGLSQKDNFDC